MGSWTRCAPIEAEASRVAGEITGGIGERRDAINGVDPMATVVVRMAIGAAPMANGVGPRAIGADRKGTGVLETAATVETRMDVDLDRLRLLVRDAPQCQTAREDFSDWGKLPIHSIKTRRVRRLFRLMALWSEMTSPISDRPSTCS